MKKFIVIAILPLLLSSCGSKNKPDDKNIIVAASSTPHAVILDHIKPAVAEKGYNLDVRVVADYVTPNILLNNGDIDANYFQHEPYLNDYNSSNGTHLISAFKVHFEPMGIYSFKHKDLSAVSPVVAIPNDVSNRDRALSLLSDKGIKGTITQLEAQVLPSVLNDVDYAVINGNYALASNVTAYCLDTESSTGTVATTNANLVAVKEEYKDYPFVTILRDCLLTEDVRTFISDTFGSAVKVVF